MSSSQRHLTSKHSRPNGGIDPIRIEELLGASGMSGFLGILEPPAPATHLRGRLTPEIPGVSADRGLNSAGVSHWFQLRLEALVFRIGTQSEVLTALLEVLGRMHAAAGMLDRRAVLLQSGGLRGIHANHRKEATSMKKKEAARGKAAHRGSATKWEDWLTQSAGSAGPNQKDLLHEAIARLAYSYWEARGWQGGSAEEDWLRAEAEIRGALAARALEAPIPEPEAIANFGQARRNR